MRPHSNPAPPSLPPPSHTTTTNAPRNRFSIPPSTSAPSPPPPFPPSPNPVPTIWCAPNSKTYIIITPSSTTPPSKLSPQILSSILTALTTANSQIANFLSSHDDGPVPATSKSVVYDYTGHLGVRLSVQNWEGRQVTWGVLGAAVGALAQWMWGGEGRTGYVFFEVVDGTTRVGFGTVE